jgi:hypothetical protein
MNHSGLFGEAGMKNSRPTNVRNTVSGQECFVNSFSDPDSIRSVDPYPDPGGYYDPQKQKKIKKFHVLNEIFVNFWS